MGKWFIDSGMRRGTPKAGQEHVITVYRGVGDWKKHLDYRAPNDEYFVLLDRVGRVAWRHAAVAVDEQPDAALAAQMKSLFAAHP